MRGARAGRGLLAAAVATFAASVSHSVADGEPAPWLGILLALTLSTPVCVALARRRFSWVRLSLAIGASQFAFHGLLLVGVGMDGAAAALPGGHAHGAAAIAPVLADAAPAVAPSHTDPGMWIAHAIAAAVTILAFGLGERALRALLALSGWSLAARLVTWRPAPVAPRLPAPVGRVFAAHRFELSSVVRRRGPPLAA